MSEARRLAAWEAARPFDLAEGPLFRVVLLGVGPQDAVLLLTLHHIISDGASTAVLIRELEAVYEGRAHDLPPLAIQYADYALWQQDASGVAALAGQAQYWRRQLAGPLPVLELPGRRGAGAREGGPAATASAVLDAASTAALQQLSRGQGATLFLTLLASFKALLHRYTGTTDIIVGTPVAGRNRPELAPLVGCFVNTLALRTDCSGDPTFLELLGRVRRTAIEAWANGDVPFEQVIEDIRPARVLDQQPVFQVLFAMEDVSAEPMRLHALEIERWNVGNAAAKFELSVWIRAGREGLHIEIEYARDLYPGGIVEQMLVHWRRVLGAVAAEPDGRLGDLPLLSADERRTLVDVWAAGPPAPVPPPVTQLFDQVAARRAAAVAVRDDRGRIWSYAELESRANGWARHLQRHGVRRGSCVGICLERSCEMVAAVLAVLKAGAAYVPLDPAFPRDRLEWMCSDAGLALIVSEHALRGLLPPSGSVLWWEDEAGEAERPDVAPLAVPIGPDDLAYILYTSGSTGRPKGVMVPHRGLANLVASFTETLGFSSSDVLLATTSLSFDIAGLELFVPLTAGGTVAVAGTGALRDAGHLAAELRRTGAGFLQAVPAAWRMLLIEGGLPRLKGALCGGEALPADVARRLPEISARAWNVYGPTETAIWSTQAALTGDGALHIGRPIANTQACVLDAAGRLVPPGVAGELYLAGAGVAQGYRNRPALTAERFLPNPFGTGGSRMYRTGDIVRWNPDGTLEYLGRGDDQVKIRGHRIEPGEIEKVLCECDGVGAAAVVAVSAGDGERRLAAYVTPRSAGAADLDDLRRAAQARLPEYMVPTAWVQVPELPLTANGKVDRRALATLDLPLPERATLVSPRNAVEHALADIWSEVLGLERVSVHDDFFAIGGHSLLATQVAARVRERLGIELPLRRIFALPRLEALAAEMASSPEGTPRRRPIVRRDRRSPAPLSLAQQRLWIAHQLQPDDAVHNIFETLHLNGGLEVEALAGAFNALIARHEIYRTTFAAPNGDPVQEIRAPWTLRIPVVDVSAVDREAALERVRELAAAEAARPFDLGAGPLLRVGLYRLGPREHVALIAMHHIVGDGASLRLLVREISAAYSALRAGRVPAATEPLLQYADYAVWEREDDGATVQESLEYWRQQLMDAPPLDLRTDRLRPATPSHRGDVAPLVIAPAAAERLREIARREGATLFMALTAAWQVLLAKCSGREDVTIGTPVANRTRRETEEMFGLFVNLLALRGRLGRGESYLDRLRDVRAVALEAYTRQDVPFARIVAELHPARQLGRTPIFQAMVVLQDASAEAFAMADVRGSYWETCTYATPYELTLNLRERADGAIAGGIEYALDLFDADTVQALARRFVHLVDAVAADPQRPLSRLTLLDAAERSRWIASLAAGNAMARAGCVPDWIAAQAEAGPDTVAVLEGGRSWTYGELMRRAARLARRLAAAGVRPESRVGVSLPRGAGLLAALLGVWKAGGVYVPLDPAQPAAWLEDVARDAEIDLLVTDTDGAARGIVPGGTRFVFEDDGTDVVWATPAPPRPSNAAYVLYTSGSTGRPKGVEVDHRALAAFTEAVTQRLDLNARDRVLQFAACGFDVFLEETLPALSIGAAVVVPPAPWPPGAAEFWEHVEQHAVTVCDLPSGYWEHLVWDLDQTGRRLPASLRLMIVGSEPTSAEGVRRWRRLGTPLIHAYGVTEATVTSTAHDVSRAPEAEVPIGSALACARVYVLDDELEPVPAGVPGALYIGGAALARGYVRQPALTAERFLPDPFAAAGARLYRTGDRACWTSRGELIFLGRGDRQVKVRGHRVELEEIERRIVEHETVQRAVVVIRQDVGEVARVTAYVMARPGRIIDPRGMALWLATRVPAHMVPAAWMVVDRFDLTANGKVDRRALPAPAPVEPPADPVAPRDEVEATLAAVWQEVLGVERCFATSDFFHLGGNSLQAMRLLAHIAAEFEVDLALHEVFDKPVLADLAQLIATRRADQATDAASSDAGQPAASTLP